MRSSLGLPQKNSLGLLQKKVLMYRKVCHLILLSYTFLTPGVAFAGWFGPSDYDECIIEGMKGVQSDLATRLVQNSCLKKFPPKEIKEPESKAMPPEAKEILKKVDSGVIYRNKFMGSIYNGNSDWTVTELTINIWVKDRSSSIAKNIEHQPPEVLFQSEEFKNRYRELRKHYGEQEAFDIAKLEKQPSQKYRVKVNIPPYTDSSFSISVRAEMGNYHWTIDEARGYK